MPAPDTPHRFPLPPRVLKLIGIAFAGGLLLFLLVWWDQRNDTDFFTAREATPDGGEPAGLPVPLPADVATGDDTASGLRVLQAPDGSAPAPAPRPVQIEAPPPPPPPAAEAAPKPPAGDRVDPSPLSTPAPKYPSSALRRGVGGTVQVRVTVATDGSVERLELAQTSGNRDLDRAALEAMRRWRFKPATQGGQPVVADVIVPLDFAPQR